MRVLAFKKAGDEPRVDSFSVAVSSFDDGVHVIHGRQCPTIRWTLRS